MTWLDDFDAMFTPESVHGNRTHDTFVPVFWFQSEQADLPPRAASDIALRCFEFIVGFLGVIMNMFMMVTVLSSERLSDERSAYLNVSLAVSDILICGGILIFDAVQYAIHFDHDLEPRPSLLVCRLWASYTTFACASSSLNIPAIALDRYIVISRPLHYDWVMTECRMITLVSGVWLTSCAVAMLPMTLPFAHDVASMPNTTNSSSSSTVNIASSHPLLLCHMDSPPHTEVLMMLLVIFLPAIVLVIVYAMIYQVSLEHRKSNYCHHVLGRLIELSTTHLKAPEDCPPLGGSEWQLGPAWSMSPFEHILALESSVDVSVRGAGGSLSSTVLFSDLSEVEQGSLSPVRSAKSAVRHLVTIESQSVLPIPELDYYDLTTPPLQPPAPPSSPLPTSIRSAPGSLRTSSELTFREVEDRKRSSVYKQASRASKFITNFFSNTLNAGDKAFRVLTLVVGTYLLCWLPLGFASIIAMAWPGSVSHRTGEILLWAAYYTACFNPVVYSMCNKQLWHEMQAKCRGRAWLASKRAESRLSFRKLMRTYSYTMRRAST